jgi:hypothetical protein
MGRFGNVEFDFFLMLAQKRGELDILPTFETSYSSTALRYGVRSQRLVKTENARGKFSH